MVWRSWGLRHLYCGLSPLPQLVLRCRNEPDENCHLSCPFCTGLIDQFTVMLFPRALFRKARSANIWHNKEAFNLTIAIHTRGADFHAEGLRCGGGWVAVTCTLGSWYWRCTIESYWTGKMKSKSLESSSFRRLFSSTGVNRPNGHRRTCYLALLMPVNIRYWALMNWINLFSLFCFFSIDKCKLVIVNKQSLIIDITV